MHGRGIVHRDIKVRTRACAHSDRCGYQAGSAPASPHKPLLYFGSFSFLPGPLYECFASSRVARDEVRWPGVLRFIPTFSQSGDLRCDFGCLGCYCCTEDGIRYHSGKTLFFLCKTIDFLAARAFGGARHLRRAALRNFSYSAVPCASVVWAGTECAASVFPCVLPRTCCCAHDVFPTSHLLDTR